MPDQLLKPGDFVRVMTEYNGSYIVEVVECIDDVSNECGLEPGRGFVGINRFGEELVYPDSQFVEFVVPTEDDLRGGYLPTPTRVTRSGG
jgi:hypothetical protein